MTKTEKKYRAQDALMQQMQQMFTRIHEDELYRDVDADELEKQFARVEKLFGYDANSWHRGA